MPIYWKLAGAMALIVGAVLGTVLALSLGGAFSSGEASRYELTVRFNTSVTQGDIEEAGALLRAHDEELDLAVMESFPPIGRAEMDAAAASFCQTVQAELEAKSYVDTVTCRPWETPAGGDPDAPVSADRDRQP